MDTHLILHVKGTEQETTTLPKQVVRAAISQGQITHSQLIWVPADNVWKQVRELPHLLPSQKLAPAPARVPTTQLPKVVAVPKVQTGPVPRIANATATGGIPRIAKASVAGATPQIVKAAAATPTAQPAVAAQPQPAKSYVVKEENAGSHPLKWLSIGLGVLIVGLVAVNYFLVDRPLVSGLRQTPFSQVTVYAHLGAYVQPNVIVIHVPRSTAVTDANLTDFLVALAQSTPNIPMSDNIFSRVALTSGWTANYTLSGSAWKELGDMGKEDVTERKKFILDQMGDATGDPLLTPKANEDEAAQQAEREQVWNAFAAQLTGS